MVQSNEIKTPHGLKFGVRFRKEGKTYVQVKVGKKYETLTSKDLLECVEGIRIKKLIIVPEDDSTPQLQSPFAQ